MFEKTSVKVLDPSDFKDDSPYQLKDTRCAFVLVYAEWCGHCQNFKPEYIKFADKAQFIHVYALDSDLNENIKNSFDDSKFPIRGFPTLLLFKNGKPVEEYSGERTASALLQKATKFCSEKCKCDN